MPNTLSQSALRLMGIGNSDSVFKVAELGSGAFRVQNLVRSKTALLGPRYRFRI